MLREVSYQGQKSRDGLVEAGCATDRNKPAMCVRFCVAVPCLFSVFSFLFISRCDFSVVIMDFSFVFSLVNICFYSLSFCNFFFFIIVSLFFPLFFCDLFSFFFYPPSQMYLFPAASFPFRRPSSEDQATPFPVSRENAGVPPNFCLEFPLKGSTPLAFFIRAGNNSPFPLFHLQGAQEVLLFT